MILYRDRIKFKTIHCIEVYYLFFQVEWSTFLDIEVPEYEFIIQVSNDQLLAKSLLFKC